MRVFVTGASGWVGSAVVRELIGAGHRVLGLVRSDAGADALVDAGAEVHRGSLEDLDSLRSGAAQADAVIHTAFNHDFSKFADNCRMEGRAVDALGTVLEGSDRQLIVTSGLALIAPNRTAVETDPAVTPGEHYPRESEARAVALRERGVRASVVRLAPSVHGVGDCGFVPHIIALAREKGVSPYVGAGLNRWPAVHRLDAAQVYRLALERGIDSGALHAVAEEGVPFKDIATVIGRQLRVPVVSYTAEEAAAHFGWLARFVAMDVPASSEATRKMLGWTPTQIGLIADVDQPEYSGLVTI